MCPVVSLRIACDENIASDVVTTTHMSCIISLGYNLHRSFQTLFARILNILCSEVLKVCFVPGKMHGRPKNIKYGSESQNVIIKLKLYYEMCTLAMPGPRDIWPGSKVVDRMRAPGSVERSQSEVAARAAPGRGGDPEVEKRLGSRSRVRRDVAWARS